MFWVDAKMVFDYQHFGDVITFDTTFKTSKAARPLGVLVVVTSSKYCCMKEGFRVREKEGKQAKNPRANTRCGCLAHLSVSRVEKN